MVSGLTCAFIDMGDQFLALQKGRTQAADEGRHFGLVVDDKDAVRKALSEAAEPTLRLRVLIDDQVGDFLWRIHGAEEPDADLAARAMD